MSFDAMSQATRKRLVQMACVAAWSDMSIAQVEREVVMNLASSLGLSEPDLAEVQTWLKHPPPDFDPYDIPREHRQTFLDALVTVMKADGRLDPEESETLRLISELVS